MRLFAAHNFRHLGIDYAAGWFNVADSLGASLIAYGYASLTDNPLVDKTTPSIFPAGTNLPALHAASPLPQGPYMVLGSSTVWVSDGVTLTPLVRQAAKLEPSSLGTLGINITNVTISGSTGTNITSMRLLSNLDLEGFAVCLGR